MADFSKAVKLILDHEGGYQNKESDFGNYNAYDSDGNLVPYKERKGRTLRAGTNMGISAAFLSGKLKRVVTVAEVQGITREKAVQIYKMYFWDDIQGDGIKDQQVAEAIMDARVLHGGTGVRLLQKALNALGASLAVDGAFGPLTLAATNAADPAKLVNALASVRAGFVKNLVEKEGYSNEWLNGWLSRINKFRVEVAEAVRKVPPFIPITIGLGLAALIYYKNE